SSPAPRPLGATERCAQNTLWSAPGEATILFPISPSARVLSPTTHPTPTLQKLSQSIARPLPLMARPELKAALRGQHCSLQECDGDYGNGGDSSHSDEDGSEDGDGDGNNIDGEDNGHDDNGDGDGDGTGSNDGVNDYGDDDNGNND
ncbi:unnamed protein product, partial [Rangifer tarandus platyrhynchus]